MFVHLCRTCKDLCKNWGFHMAPVGKQMFLSSYTWSENGSKPKCQQCPGLK